MMRWIRILAARLRALLHRDVVADEIHEELQFHLSMRTEEYERRGLTPEAARRKATRRVGNLALHQDRGYDVRGGGMMETVIQDIRYSVRLLIKQRGFALVAILTLALGIGAVTAVVSVIDATMLRPLPYPDPEQLVRVGVTTLRPDGRPVQPSPAMTDMRNWQASEDVFSSVVAWRRVIYGRIVDGEQPERVQVTEVTEQFLRMYGVAPLHGRDFNLDDMFTGAPPVLILGYGYWQSRFGGDPDVIGQVVRMGEESATIVGVLPAAFASTQLLRPLPARTEREARRRGSGTDVYARLRPDITPEQAAERLSARMDEPPGPDGSTPEVSVRVDSLLERTTERHWTTVAVLAGAVGLILMLACVNVAGLQLARGATRQPELAVRASLGAGRARLVRQLLVESGVLAVAGSLIGVLVAWVSLDALVANLPISLPSNVPVRVNLLVLAASAVVTVITVVLFGLIPALRLSRVRIGTALAGASRRHGSSLSRRGSQLLMAAEIGLAVVLVVGAALMLRSFSRVMSVDIGFDPAAFVTMEVLPLTADPTAQADYYPALLRNLRLIPGVTAAGAVDHLPLGGSSAGTAVMVEGQGFGIGVRRVLPGYVAAIGLPLVGGRTLSDADYTAGSAVAMINQAAARELFPGVAAVGRSLTIYGDAWSIIGIIGDVRHRGPLRDVDPEVFLPFQGSESALRRARALTVVVRLDDQQIPDLVDRLSAAAEAVGPRVLVERVRSGDDWLEDRVITPRRRTVLLTLLGSLGLLLALVGVFGLTAYSVARRTQEIGIRMTFGARPDQIVAAIVRDAAVPVVGGIAVGLVGAVLATRVIESFLFETTPTDPATFAAVAVTLGVAGCVAAWIPARRAVRVDPVTALRTD